jgi:hypothetical protein
MRTLLATILLGLAGLLVASTPACSPFDPSLPAQPFRCNTTEPKCPDGFACIDQGTNKFVCEPTTGLPDGGTSIDSTAFSCNDDTTLEPNDGISNASPTNVAGSRKSITLAQLAICPAGDKDTFTVEVVVANTNIEAIATVTGGEPVSVSILNSSGVAITNGSQTATMTRAYTANAPTGTYYVQVFGTATSRTNYNLAINTTP